MVYTTILALGSWGTGESGIPGHLWLHMELEASLSYMFCFETKQNNNNKPHIPPKSTSAPATLGHYEQNTCLKVRIL